MFEILLGRYSLKLKNKCWFENVYYGHLRFWVFLLLNMNSFISSFFLTKPADPRSMSFQSTTFTKYLGSNKWNSWLRKEEGISRAWEDTQIQEPVGWESMKEGRLQNVGRLMWNTTTETKLYFSSFLQIILQVTDLAILHLLSKLFSVSLLLFCIITTIDHMQYAYAIQMHKYYVNNFTNFHQIAPFMWLPSWWIQF